MAHLLKPLILSPATKQPLRRYLTTILNLKPSPLSTGDITRRQFLTIKTPSIIIHRKNVHVARSRGLRPADVPLPAENGYSDGDSDEERKSRNAKKREAKRGFRWAMELAEFNDVQIKRILRVIDLEREVFDAVMLVKRLGCDVREGKRRQFSYIGRLLRDVEPELIDGLIRATKDGDMQKFQEVSGSDKSEVKDADEEEEETNDEDEDEQKNMEDKSPLEHKKYAADIDSITKAQALIKPYIHITPVLSSDTLNSIAEKNLFFKCECFQKGGAFKFRGASNAIFSLNDEQAAKGVVTHSSGNHAAALALAAKLRGIPAYIVIPKNAPNCKVENVRRYGGQIIWSEANMKSREETANKVLNETGAELVHPYNDGRIIRVALSLEFLDQVPQLDTLIVPISGGGLISGVAIGAKSVNPAIRILAAEPKGADDAAQSKASGRIVTLAQTNTIADGLRASLGDLTWPVVRDLVDDIITVDDKDIVKAMKYCYEILKVAIEPSGAIGRAAVLSDSFKQSPAWKDSRNIGIVFSGGNVDLGVLWESLNS